MPDNPSTEDARIERKAYVGTLSCGCTTYALVAGIETKRQEKASLKAAMKEGHAIEVTTVADARKRLSQCPHTHPLLDKEGIDAELDRLTGEARA